MYFGSVNFFKQLIYSTVICFAVLSAAFALVFGIKCSAPPEELPSGLPEPVKQVLSAAITDGKVVIPEGSSMAEIYEAMSEMGYTSEEIMKFIAENDSETLYDFISSAVNVNSDAPAYEIGDDGTYSEIYAPHRTDNSGVNDIYLLFDRSPSQCTSDLLTILENQQIKAVFLIDDNGEAPSGKLLRRIASEGHSVGIKLTKRYASTDECMEAVSMRFTQIYTSAGIKPSVIYTDIDQPDEVREELEGRKFTVCTADVRGDEVPKASWQSVYTNSVEKTSAAGGRSVLLLHGGDDDTVTVSAAEDIISRLKDDGFGFAIPGGTAD